ncbi:MAG: hypothetical protein KJ747_03800, partial [Actinobacteria bacterium]|nr:hypothetical protein [Actinomycetota bacterium]
MARLLRRDSLADNIMVLGLTLVLLAITIVGSTALIGVYSLANESADARQVAYLQATSAQVSARLDASAQIIDKAESILADSSDKGINRVALAEQYDSGIEYIDRLLVVRPDGTLVSAYPAFAAPMTVGDEVYFQGAASETTTFRYLRSDGYLWVRRAVDGSDGPLVILARVRTSFLKVLLDGFASPSIGRMLYAADSDNTAIESGVAEVALDLSTAQYAPLDSDPSSGHVDVLTEQ